MHARQMGLSMSGPTDPRPSRRVRLPTASTAERAPSAPVMQLDLIETEFSSLGTRVLGRKGMPVEGATRASAS